MRGGPLFRPTAHADRSGPIFGTLVHLIWRVFESNRTFAATSTLPSTFGIIEHSRSPLHWLDPPTRLPIDELRRT